MLLRKKGSILNSGNSTDFILNSRIINSFHTHLISRHCFGTVAADEKPTSKNSFVDDLDIVLYVYNVRLSYSLEVDTKLRYIVKIRLWTFYSFLYFTKLAFSRIIIVVIN